MTNNTDFARVSKITQEQSSLAICLPTVLTVDNLAAATALYLALTKLSKQVSLCSVGVVPKEIDLVGIEKITKEISTDGDNLIVSFPYKEGAIDKVTYNIEDERFNLVITPHEGRTRLDPSQVRYRYKGGSVGALIVLDTPTLNSLGDLYAKNKEQFTGVDLINIDRHFTNANFGSVNIVDKKASSLSELILELLVSLNIALDRDIATNLYTGIVGATNNFTAYSVGAATFETAAHLLKAGAVKKPIGQTMPSGSMPRPISPVSYQTRPQTPMSGMPQGYPPQASAQDLRPQAPGAYQPDGYNNEDFGIDTAEELGATAPAPVQHVQAAGPSESVVTIPGSEQPSEVEKKESKETPKDWLKPKIFKGPSGGLG